MYKTKILQKTESEKSIKNTEKRSKIAVSKKVHLNTFKYKKIKFTLI